MLKVRPEVLTTLVLMMVGIIAIFYFSAIHRQFFQQMKPKYTSDSDTPDMTDERDAAGVETEQKIPATSKMIYIRDNKGYSIHQLAHHIWEDSDRIYGRSRWGVIPNWAFVDTTQFREIYPLPGKTALIPVPTARFYSDLNEKHNVTLTDSVTGITVNIADTPLNRNEAARKLVAIVACCSCFHIGILKEKINCKKDTYNDP